MRTNRLGQLGPIATLLCLLAVTIVAATAGAAGTPAPRWAINVHHNPTNFAPGGTGQYWVDVKNIGDAPTSGPITVTVDLPDGITLNHLGDQNSFDAPDNWSCPTASAGTSTVVCTRNAGLLQHQGDNSGIDSRSFVVTADVAPAASGVVTAVATVEGGGAADPASEAEPTQIDSGLPGFGIVPGTFVTDFFDSDLIGRERQAGAHPYLARFSFDFNSVPKPSPSVPERTSSVESVRNLRLDLPQGFLGNPTAVGECSPSQLLARECPRSSQVGYANVLLFPATDRLFENYQAPIFNMVHPRGAITDLAFEVVGNPVHIKASLDPANHYSIVTTVSNINESLVPFTSDVTIWGVPKDSSHDYERCGGSVVQISGNACPSDGPEKAFLTVPNQCEDASQVTLRDMDTWQNSGVVVPPVTYELPGKFSGCDAPRFEPDVEVVPTGKQANTPTGLDVHIKVPQNENANGLSTPPVKRTVITLPKGMSFSPSFADGLQSCALSEIRLANNDPVACPGASRIGEVTLSTPLLPKPLQGSMYLAAQDKNPFGSMFALYLVLEDTEERGALLKIPGRLDVDPTTGQITAIFDETPQLPFDDLTLKFRSGSRAPLVNPPSCGVQTIGVEVASWAQPNVPVDASNTYDVSEGPNGTACPADPARRPFRPSFSGGTMNPAAGTFSPFVFRLERGDSEQELSQVRTTLPEGLLAKIAGIQPCPDAAIASISTATGAGTAERDNPACPAASQIGTLSAGLGAGPGPNYFPGKVYLAGPYKGAPLSLAIVAPGLAGPFDLGNVVVRTAVYVDSSNAQVTAVSDPFPTILHGVILRVRDVRLRIDRPETTLNPTSCEPKRVTAEISGIGGDLLSTADDSSFSAFDPFQAGDCGALGFAPKLSLRLIGGTRRSAHPSLRAHLRMPAGGSNIARASVALPRSEFLDQAHIKTVCTRVQYAADQCPAGSIYGFASAKTPLFDQPLSGPVYLRSNGGERVLPDLVAKLRGPASQPVQVDLVGYIDSLNGGIRNTFDIVPDAPVETFSLRLQGGKKGLLVNSQNLCERTHRFLARFKGQNGKVSVTRPVLKNGCKGSKRGKQQQAARSLVRLLSASW